MPSVGSVTYSECLIDSTVVYCLGSEFHKLLSEVFGSAHFHYRHWAAVLGS